MFNISAFLSSLPIMGLGMAGIFAVIIIIILCVMLLNKLFPYKKD